MRAFFNRLTYGFAAFKRLRYGLAVLSRLNYGLAVFGGFAVVRLSDLITSESGVPLTTETSLEALVIE